jgi:NhaP-type Na+/H+ or K+/H+ antiporter
MKDSILIYFIIGLIGISFPWVGRLEKTKFINLPMLCVIFGALLYLLPLNLPSANPLQHNNVLIKLSELAVLISLMGTGLKLDTPFSLKAYRLPLLLVFVTMILCIGAMAWLGSYLFLAPASAILLAAAFAPTDPVIAQDTQVEMDEAEEDTHPVRFALTAEAGLNDGMAFPFTWLAIAVAAKGLDPSNWLADWFVMDFLYRIIAGIVLGLLIGKFIAWLYLKLPKKLGYFPEKLEFLAFATLLLVYGVTEAVHGYGFIAVFVAAMAIRQSERDNEFHAEMHHVISQMEKFFIAIFLILLGGYTVTIKFDHLSWEAIVLVLVSMLIFRPLFGYLATLGSKLTKRERLVVSFMGIKGIGSIFYLAYALDHAFFPQKEELWATVAFAIIVSVFMHGLAGYLLKPLLQKKPDQPIP